MSTDFEALSLLLAWYLLIRDMEHCNFAMKFHEIAEIWECLISTVKSRLKVRLRHLKQMLVKQE